jgi:hypothetical protein
VWPDPFNCRLTANVCRWFLKAEPIEPTGKNATRDFPKFSVAGRSQHIREALPIRAHAWVMPERALDRDQVPTPPR